MVKMKKEDKYNRSQLRKRLVGNRVGSPCSRLQLKAHLKDPSKCRTIAKTVRVYQMVPDGASTLRKRRNFN